MTVQTKMTLPRLHITRSHQQLPLLLAALLSIVTLPIAAAAVAQTVAQAAALTTPAKTDTALRERLIVLNKQENTMSVVDPATMKVIGSIATGEGPHEAVVSADGKFAIVANYGAQRPGNSLSVIDIDAIKEIRRHDLGALKRPHGMQLVNGRVYFTSELARAVARYDIVSDRVDWIMGTGASATHMLAVTPDARRLYTTNIASNNVTAIRLDGPPSPANITQIAVGAQPEALDISPDGRELWVGHNGDGSIAIIDIDTNTVKHTMQVGLLPIRLKFSPDGKRVLVSDPKGGASGEVIVLDAQKRMVEKRIALAGVPLGIQFAADGKRAFVSRAQARRVDVVDMQTLAVSGSVETGDAPDGLAWRAGM
jgi:YVTN family beta-propeller protein